MSPNHLPLSATLKIMVLSYGDHLSNVQYSMGRNGHRPKWLWAEMVMDRNGNGPK